MRIIVNYGSPRSGTNFMRWALSHIEGVCVFKLEEGRLLHPCRSHDGLIELGKMLRVEQLTLIRTVRHPMEIAESFLALRLDELDGVAPNLARRTDEQVVDYINFESENTAKQREALLDPPYEHNDHEFIEVRYEDLADPDKRLGFAQRVAPGSEGFLSALSQFGVKPTKGGRLSAGLGSVMTLPEQKWFRRKLAQVIEDEDYT